MTPCTWGGNVRLPNGRMDGWSCPNRAVQAVKVRPEGVKAFTDAVLPIEHAPLCREHMTEVAGRIEDWMDIGEWEAKQREARRSVR